jgi:hypothetical protein
LLKITEAGGVFLWSLTVTEPLLLGLRKKQEEEKKKKKKMMMMKKKAQNEIGKVGLEQPTSRHGSVKRAYQKKGKEEHWPNPPGDPWGYE